MRSFRSILTAGVAALVVSALLVGAALASSSRPSTMHSMAGMAKPGVTGSKSFPAAAKTLDNNSVALSKAIASVYGVKAGNTFLNGKNMWRDHIKDFVAYTVATAKHDKAGQKKAVASLKQYTVTFGN